MKALALVSCNSCGATYRPIQADGLEYYHACPPSRAVDDGAVDDNDPSKGRKVRRVAIDNPRDENIAGRDDDGKTIIKSSGKGVTPITDAGAIDAFLNTSEVR